MKKPPATQLPPMVGKHADTIGGNDIKKVCVCEAKKRQPAKARSSRTMPSIMRGENTPCSS